MDNYHSCNNYCYRDNEKFIVSLLNYHKLQPQKRAAALYSDSQRYIKSPSYKIKGRTFNKYLTNSILKGSALEAGVSDDYAGELAAGVFTVLEGVDTVDEHVVDTL